MRGAVLISLVAAGGAQQQCTGRTQAQCSGDCQWVNNACNQICFRSNVAYTGDMRGQPITNEANQDACKLRCQNTAGCATFTFYANSGDCHLQDSTASRTAESGAVSGDVDCVEPTTNSASGGTTSSAGGGDPNSFAGTGGSASGDSLAGGSGSVPGSNSGAVQLPASTGGGSNSAAAQLPASTGGGAGGSNGFSSSSGGLGSAAGADQFASGNVESMPSNVGGAMVVGSAQAQGSFSGLNAVFSLKAASSAEGLGWVSALTSGIALLAALVYGSRRIQREGGHAAARSDALTSADADVAE